MPNFTQKAIREAFLQLLEERPLARITVKDIVERCGINRNTFYYHYQDINALLEEISKGEVDRIIAEYPSFDSLETCLDAAVDFAEKNRRAMLHLYRLGNRDLFERDLREICTYAVSTYFKTAFSHVRLRGEDRDLLLRVFRNLAFGTVLEWMDEGMRRDLRAQIHRACELNSGLIEEMIRRVEAQDD